MGTHSGRTANGITLFFFAISDFYARPRSHVLEPANIGWSGQISAREGQCLGTSARHIEAPLDFHQEVRFSWSFRKLLKARKSEDKLKRRLQPQE